MAVRTEGGQILQQQQLVTPRVGEFVLTVTVQPEGRVGGEVS